MIRWNAVVVVVAVVALFRLILFIPNVSKCKFTSPTIACVDCTKIGFCFNVLLCFCYGCVVALNLPSKMPSWKLVNVHGKLQYSILIVLISHISLWNLISIPALSPFHFQFIQSLYMYNCSCVNAFYVNNFFVSRFVCVCSSSSFSS